MDTETVNAITGYLDKIAEKIGVAAEQVWPWLIQQQYVEAFSATFSFVLFFALFMLGLRYVFNFDWDLIDESVNDTAKKTVSVIFTTLLAAGALVSFIATTSELPDIFNPEYHALMDLIRKVK